MTVWASEGSEPAPLMEVSESVRPRVARDSAVGEDAAARDSVRAVGAEVEVELGVGEAVEAEVEVGEDAAVEAGAETKLAGVVPSTASSTASAIAGEPNRR